MAGGVRGYLQFAFLMVTSLHIWLGGVLGVVLSFLKRCAPFQNDRLRLLNVMQQCVCQPTLKHHEFHINAASLCCRSPGTFFFRKDRSRMQFEDCAPGLTHEYHVVNGVRHVLAFNGHLIPVK